MFKKFITEQDMCNEWALFKVGDEVITLVTIQDDKGVLLTGTTLTVTDVTCNLLENKKFFVSDINMLEIKNQWNGVFTYSLKDDKGNDLLYSIDERKLISKNATSTERKEAIKHLNKRNAIGISLMIILIIFICLFFTSFTLMSIILGIVALIILFLLGGFAIIIDLIDKPRIVPKKRERDVSKT